MLTNIHYLIRMTLLLFIILLGACSTVPDNIGRDDVTKLVKERGVSLAEKESVDAISSLLDQPLNKELAVQIALLNNPGLRQSYTRLGIGAADLYEASRVRNPVLSIGILDSNNSADLLRQTFSFVTSLSDFITLSSRKKFAEQEFLAIKQDIASKILSTAIDAEESYYRLSVAEENARLYRHIAYTAELTLQLAERYRQAGNLSAHELSVKQADFAQAKLDLLMMEANAYSERVVLANILGVSVSRIRDIEHGLVMPTPYDYEIDTLLALAYENRLDIAAAEIRADNLAKRRGLTHWRAWLGELNIGIEYERETDGSRLSGPLLDWELPIFSQYRDQFLRADAELQQAVIEVARLRLATENEVRLTYAAMQNTASRIKAYQDHLIPARKNVVVRSQEQEAFMLIGIFELLEVKQQEYETYYAYINALGDYWLANTSLSRAVGKYIETPEGEHRVSVSKLIPSTDAVSAVEMDKKNHHLHHGSHDISNGEVQSIDPQEHHH